MRYSRMQDIKPGKKGNTGIFFFISVFAIAAVVYFIGAAKVGNFISEKIFTPVIAWITGEEADPSEEVSPSATDQSLQTIEVEIAGSSIYALQVGAYSEIENAQAVAVSLQQKGGAGYIYADTEINRVFIAAYLSKSEAQNVQERLLSEQEMDTGIYEITTDAVRFSITADLQTIQSVRSIAESLNTYQEELISLALEYDKGNVGTAAAAAKAADLVEDIRAKKNTLDILLAGSSDKTLKSVSEFYETVEDALGDLTEDLSTVEMSARIKGTYMQVCFAKYTLVTELSLL